MKKSKNHDDRLTVDNSTSELYYVKKKFKLLKLSSVLLAKDAVGNKRADIYNWFYGAIGETVESKIETIDTK